MLSEKDGDGDGHGGALEASKTLLDILARYPPTSNGVGRREAPTAKPSLSIGGKI
jgi:hypothetical protein